MVLKADLKELSSLSRTSRSTLTLASYLMIICKNQSTLILNEESITDPSRQLLYVVLIATVYIT